MRKMELIKRLKNYDFPDEIIDALKKVDRTLFVPIDLKKESYEDVALPIGQGQTISQPYTIAFMLSLMEIEERQKILEIGSGSGYVLALLAELNDKGKILGIERVEKLANESREKLKDYSNVEIIHGNILTNLRKEKFDRILASAAFKEIPQKLINDHLKMKGIFVGPVRDTITTVRKESGQNKIDQYAGFSFVPIVYENEK